jgi:hypothetical protein
MADKLGNIYERWWTVDALLDVLVGNADAIQIEVPGSEDAKAEFRLIKAGIPEWHQVKRQTSERSWTVPHLDRIGVLGAFWDKIVVGEQCVFVSTTSAGDLQEVAERAAMSQSWSDFTTHMLNRSGLEQAFDELCTRWGSPPDEEVFDVLNRKLLSLVVISEDRLRAEVTRRTGSVVSGDSAAAVRVLHQLAEDRLQRTLYADEIEEVLAEAGHARHEPGDPVVVSAVPAGEVGGWLAGAEVTVGDDTYLLTGASLAEEPAPDRSAVRRRARALPVARSGAEADGYVWLRQVSLTPGPGRPLPAAADALARERDLLAQLCAVPGIPLTVDFALDGPTTSLILDWPLSPVDRGPCESLDAWLGEPVTDPWVVSGLVAGFSHLVGSLERLHRLGASHRDLAPEAVLVLDGRRFGLRDLGLAGVDPRPGEGPAQHQAPEQRRRGRSAPGPATDAYQVAALCHHLVTGHPPHPTSPLPLAVAAPVLPAGLAGMLDACLVDQPEHRPDLVTLGAALRNAGRDLP